MKKIEKSFIKIKKWCLKPLSNLLLGLAILAATIVVVLHIPMVQQQLLSRVLHYLHKTTHYDIKCDALRLTWFRQIKLEGLTIRDPWEKPLFSIDLCKGKLNLWDLWLLKPNIIDSVSVAGGVVYLEKDIKEDINIVTFYKKVILPFVPEVQTDLSIDKIWLDGINVRYQNAITGQAINIEHIQLAINHFFSSVDHHSGHITQLTYQATNDLVLKNLTTEFTITPHTILLKDCHLMTQYSNLQGDCTLSNSQGLPIVTNKENLVCKARLDKTVLSSIDLSKFSDFFQGAHTLYKLDGSVALTPHSVAWQNCRLVFGSSESYVQTTGAYNGMDADILVQAGMVHINDLPQKPPLDLPGLKYMGITDLTFVGNTHKARLKGDLTTNIGALQTELTLHHLGKPRQEVSGNLTLHKLAIDTPLLPIVSLSGTVKLKIQGTQFNTLDTVAHLTEIKTQHYTYKQIKAACIMADGNLTYKLDSKDPNAKLAFSGSYNRASGGSLQAQGIIEQIHLQKLGGVPTPLTIGAKFSLQSNDIFKKHPQGILRLNQCMVASSTEKIACDQVVLHSLQHGEEHVLTLTSPLIDGRLQGIFTINDLAGHIQYLAKRLNKPVDLVTMAGRLDLDYVINCKNIPPILNWFSNHLYIAPATTFWGHFAYDTDYHFSLDLPSASTISFKEYSLQNIEVKLNMEHLMNATNRSIELSIASDKQHWHEMLDTDHLYFQLLLNKGRLTISNRLSSHHGHLSIACAGALSDDAIEIHLLPSSLTTKDKIWTIETAAPSFISKTAITIGHLAITNGQTSIRLGGTLTEAPTKEPLYCTIDHLPLNYDWTVGPIKGMIEAKLVARLEKGQFTTRGRLSLKEATIQDYAIGTLRTKIDWNLLEDRLVLEGLLEKENKKLLQITGSYHLSPDHLALTATCHQMDLDLINPFVTPVCSDITGKLSGQFHLTGKRTAPKLNGKGSIDKGQVRINYLNTSYQATGAIKVQDNRLYVKQLVLHDGASGHATLSGHILLQNNFPLMIAGRMSAFHLLDTTPMHNSDFYGDLYATGTLQMEGSIYDLLFKIKATTDKGTFTIVADDKENIDNTGKLVRFVYNKADKQVDQVAENRSVIKLILDLTILPTIKTQILFGSNNTMNDSLRGQGTGAIHVEVGTNRKTYVMGNYLFDSGTYTVSVYNLIQKTFTIAPNSQVNFNGYPQEGIAHIQASYTQIASTTQLSSQSNDKRSIPVEIALAAHGKLAHPHITYQLIFPIKTMDVELNTALEECASKAVLDRNYLNKQILSLLIAKQLYNDKNIDGWNALSNSINDLLSQRIQNLASKIDHNLEIETDLGMNQAEHNRENILQKTKIKVSYLLLSERLKLSSTVGRSSCFINDWEITYRMLKAYNMHTKLYQQPLKNGYSLFGIGFSYTKQFW